jgi:hypothetical protein
MRKARRRTLPRLIADARATYHRLASAHLTHWRQQRRLMTWLRRVEELEARLARKKGGA